MPPRHARAARANGIIRTPDPIRIAPEDTLSIPASPTRLGRYEIRRELGRGTMGVVYEALDPALGRSVALKTVQPSLALSGAERELFERRFLTEARVAAGLAHPGIVVVHDVGRDDEHGLLYIALELLPGRTLAEVMAGGEPLPWREALRLVARVAEALAHAHERGVVHRDVKPANIMLLPTGEPKIMDFGIAKVPAAQLTSPGEFFGTPSYMSPEQAAGSEVDARSDQFALGAVLFLLLTGRRAFDGPNVPAILARVAHRDPPRASALVELPPEVDYVLARTLAKLPALRYPGARELAEDLDDLREGRPPRHRTGWVEPPRHELPLAEIETARELPTAELPGRGGSAATASVTRQSAPPTGPAWRVLAGAVALVALVLAVSRLGPGEGGGGASTPAGQPGASPPAVPRPSATPSPSPTPTPAPSPPEPSPGSLLRWLQPADPARLEVAFTHSFRSGILRVYVDDEVVVESPLNARVTRKVLLIYKKREGNVEEAIQVAPGEHFVRVEVEADGQRWSQRVLARFESGRVRRLSARVAGGFLEDKGVELAWVKP